MTRRKPAAESARSRPAPAAASTFGQPVLVLQGGGALGAYQAGVYEALHKAGIEPAWIVGTSIGAINGALLAGNRPARRLERLQAFWDRLARAGRGPLQAWSSWSPSAFANWDTLMRGIPGFFSPNPGAALGPHARLGIEQAAYYRTDLLRETLLELVDFDYLAAGETRLTVGAVHARTGVMRYFDSRHERLDVDHVLASGALPPAFPAVRIDGEPYWDGGIYSNTPVEVVLDDRPRRDATIFAVQLWRPAGVEPASLWEVTGRQKDIQYASRDDSHIARQQQIHQLRRVIREIVDRLPPAQRRDRRLQELAAWGCGTTMHLLRLHVPRLEGEDHTKDIDFTHRGIRQRWHAGLQDTRRAVEMAPWQVRTDGTEGILIHEIS